MEESNITFASLGLSDAMLKALEKKGYGYPTTIQAEAIPYFLQWRDVIAKAKANNVPNDNINRVLQKYASGGAGEDYESITYEGYGPKGIAVIVETLTDNRNRAAAEVRSTLTKGNGSLATSGSVSFNFERKGQIVVPSEGVDFDKLFETAAEAGAEDVTDEDRKSVV